VDVALHELVAGCRRRPRWTAIERVRCQRACTV
jgi:hypothetical protein